MVAIPVQGITWLLTPWCGCSSTLPPLQWPRQSPTTNETEIKLLASIGYQEGIIEEDEAEMIRRVFRLNDIRASDIMTPRVALTYLPGAGRSPISKTRF
jgi:CBS domain containing-hemolysin-like protein